MEENQTINVTVPGKVILHGEHAVVHYKPAIAISVGLFTNLKVEKESSPAVSLKFEGIGLDFSIPVEDMKKLQEQLGPTIRYDLLDSHTPIPLESATVRLIEDFISNKVGLSPVDRAVNPVHRKAMEAFLGLYTAIFSEVTPIKFSISTESPVGAGLGSSASFAVALAASMLRITGRVSESLTAEDKSRVNRWAYFSEQFVHGSPSGIDNYVTTYGGAVLFQRQRGEKDSVESIKCPQIRVLLVDTKVSRSTHAIIEKTNALREEHPEVWQKCMDDIGNLVESAVSNIRSDVVEPELFLKNHKILQTLGVSHESLDQIVDVAQSHGFYGKLTGAGGGGCAFVFIPEEEDGRLEALKTALTSNGFGVWDTKLGCDGVSFL